MDLAAIRQRVYDRLDEDASDPQRWPASVVTEYLNDGIQHFSSRARLVTDSVTITQRPGELFYKLPADCIEVLAVYEDEQDEALYFTSWRQLDRGVIPNGILPVPTQFRNRWPRASGIEATHAFPFGLNEIGLWPTLGSASAVNSDMRIAFEVQGDGGTTYTLPIAPGTIAVWRDTIRLEQVASSPSGLQYSVSGETLTLGSVATSAVTLRAYISADSRLVLGEELTGDKDGVNQDFTISGIPSDASAVAVYVNGVRLNNAGAPPSGGISVVAIGAFTVSGSSISIRVPPSAGSTVVADYTTSASDVIIGETPSGTKDGANKQFSLAEVPGDFAEVAVFVSGVRLGRTSGVPNTFQFVVTGRGIRLGRAPKAAEGFFVDYLRTPNAANKTFTVRYLKDVPTDVEDDTDEPIIPGEFHELLVDYVVARCLAPKARGQRVKRSVEAMSRYLAAVGQAHGFDRNVGITFSPQ